MEQREGTANLGRHPGGRWAAPAGYREIIQLAGPLVLSTGSMTVQQFVNRIFLSWYSPQALAASLPAGALSYTFLCFFIGTVSFVNTFVAQYHGSRQPERAVASVWQALYLGLLAGVLVLPLAFLARPIFNLAGHDPQVRAQECAYFRLLVLGGGFVILSSGASSFFTGLGRTWIVMAVNLGATMLNVVLDWGLIFGHLGLPRLGITGAALATVISSALAAAAFVGLFLFGPPRREFNTWAARRFDAPLAWRLVRFGAPSGLHFTLDLLAWSLFILLVGRLGMVELGATNLAFQVNNIVFLPMIGFAVATTTRVGQYLGEEKPDLAARATWSAFHLTFGYMSLIAVSYLLVPRWFLLPFGARGDTAAFAPVREMATVLLRFVAIYSLFDAANLIFSAALKGAGDTVFPVVMATSLSVGLMVAPTWVICHTGRGNIWAAWYFLSAFIIILAFCFLGRFLRGRWRTMRVTGAHHAPLSPTYPPPELPVSEAEVS